MKKIWETGRAASYNAADLASGAQRPDCAPEGSTTLNVSTTLREKQRVDHNECGSTTCSPEGSTTPNVGKKRSRLLKVFAASGLAFFMGIGTLCGVLIAPMGATSASNAGNLASAAQSADSAVSTSPLGLDPQNDPVVYTTDYGVDIKFGNISISGAKYGAFTEGSLHGYIYFTTSGTGGTYNWLIIGKSPNLSGVFSGSSVKWQLSDWLLNACTANFNEFYNNQYELNTPAGIASSQEIGLNLLNDEACISNTIVSNSEIPSNCLLCLSEDVVTTTTYGTCGGGDLTSLADCSLSALGLANLSSRLQKITIKRNQNYSTNKVTYSDVKLFSMGGYHSQFPYQNNSFSLSTYLTTSEQRICSMTYWTGDKAYVNGYQYGCYFNTSGNNELGGGTCGIRPAFVLKI